MSAKSRWMIVGAGLLLVSGVIVLVPAGRKSVESLVRPADIPRKDPASYGPPLLTFTPESVEFEEIGLGQKRTQVVQVENTGTVPVRIYRVIFPCPCMSGTVESEVLPPKQTARLSVTFTGLPGKRDYATMATIITDEPGRSKYDVPLRGKIRQDFILEPEVLAFGAFKKGENRVLEATLRRRDGKPFAIRAIQCARPEFKPEWKEQEPGKSTSYRLRISFQAERAGALTEVATVETDAPPEVSPQLTMSAEVASDFGVDPKVAVVVLGADGHPGAVDVVIRHLGGGAVPVEAVREGRGLPVEFLAGEKGADFTRVKIRLATDSVQDVPVGEFLITIAGHSDEPIHLPYRIELPPSRGSGNP